MFYHKGGILRGFPHPNLRKEIHGLTFFIELELTYPTNLPVRGCLV